MLNKEGSNNSSLRGLFMHRTAEESVMVQAFMLNYCSKRTHGYA